MSRAKEVFDNLKGNLHKMTTNQLKKVKNNLVGIIRSSKKTRQEQLLKRSIFSLSVLEKEMELLSLGFDKFVYKDELADLVDSLNMNNTSKIYLDYLENFTREIPQDVIDKFTIVDDRKIFNKYFVLFTDYTRVAEKKSKGTPVRKKEKDPILFGAFISDDGQMLSERLYFIADWVDEYCDLTLDKLVEIKPNIVNTLDELTEEEMKEIEQITERIDRNV